MFIHGKLEHEILPIFFCLTTEHGSEKFLCKVTEGKAEALLKVSFMHYFKVIQIINIRPRKQGKLAFVKFTFLQLKWPTRVNTTMSEYNTTMKNYV